jgi:OFA family oxalate/formate antiporter-like MFS transporter
MTFGITYSYSDFFIPLTKEFGWNYATASAIPAVSLLVFSIGSFLGGYFGARIGYRRMSYVGTLLVGFGTILSSQVNGFYELLLFFGILASSGNALVVIAATGLVVKWFVKKRGLAVGIMASGSGFGTLVVPVLAQYLIGDGAYWRSAFFVIGLVFLILLLVVSFFMQTPAERSLHPYGWNEMSQEERGRLKDTGLRSALKTRGFWFAYAMFFLGTIGAAMFLAEANPFASQQGISSIFAATALSIFGAGSLISRIVLASLSDKSGRRSALILSFLIESASLAGLPFVGSSISLFLVAALGIGFGYGGFLSNLIALSGDMFGMKWIERIWGVMETSFGLGGLVGPILAGVFFDAFSTYTGIMEIGALAALVSLLLAVVLPRAPS